jgi:hypothetical protein
MKGDFSRLTFDKKKHYRATRLQQGRVSVDADWNEQSDILNYRFDTETSDIVGRCGAPIHHAGFHIVRNVSELTVQEALLPENATPSTLSGAGDFYISCGRMYVAGMLVENERIIPFTKQPELPSVTPVESPGVYAAYLDVWEQHITAIEDESIREVALGGPDTSTRIKATWQVKMLLLGSVAESSSFNCVTNIPLLNESVTGTMAAQVETAAPPSSPCIVPPGAGYRRLENQLYRVEVHRGGNRSVATFKWSRDNGSVVSRWESQNGNKISVSSVGRDKILSYKAGMWVELIDDERILSGLPGTLVRIESVNDRVLTLDTSTADGSVNFTDFETNPKVRRWDSIGVLTPTNNNWLTVEDGIQVRFSSGTYKTGDYWLIPARTNTGAIEWPHEGAAAKAMLPHGTNHARCRLAIMVFNGTTWTRIDDCRPVFPPVTELMQFSYLGGDGQEALPNAMLDQPLKVGVSRGLHPVAGARVRFRRVSPAGQLLPGGMTEESGSAVERIVLTNSTGVAEVKWQLGGSGSDITQTIRAELLAPDNSTRHLTVQFNARISLASQVWYNAGSCTALAQSDTVQEALDTISAQAMLVRYGGEGQIGKAGQILLRPIQVIVTNVCGPITGASVTFKSHNNGRVAATPDELAAGGGTGTLPITTNSAGMAQVYWKLDSDISRKCQQLEVQLTAAGTCRIHQPDKLLFTACLGVYGQCYDFLDDLRADGVVSVPADAKLGLYVTAAGTSSVNFTAGVVYVGGCRYVINAGTLTLSGSSYQNSIIVNNDGLVTVLDKDNPPPAFATLADAYMNNNTIYQIVDRRKDLTHLDIQLIKVRNSVAATRPDRRRSIPLLAQTLPNLVFADGRNHGVQLSNPMGLAFDGTNIWAASMGSSVVYFPTTVSTGDSPTVIELGAMTGQCAFDGKSHMWFTSPYRYGSAGSAQLNNNVISIDIYTRAVRTYTVGNLPWAIACDGNRMWVVNTSSSSISIINTGKGLVEKTIAVTVNGKPAYPTTIVFDGQYMWVAGNSSHLFRFDTDGNVQSTDIKLVGSVRGLAFDGSHLWISHGAQTSPAPIFKIDVLTNVVQQLNSVFGYLICDGSRMWAIQHPQSELIAVATAFDCCTNTMIGNITIGMQVYGCVFDGNHLWLSVFLNTGATNAVQTIQGVRKYLIN